VCVCVYVCVCVLGAARFLSTEFSNYVTKSWEGACEQATPSPGKKTHWNGHLTKEPPIVWLYVIDKPW